jgi:threonine aldolase
VKPSDFRSDTVTQPSPAMRAAIAAAEVGDDVLDGDPTVRALEAKTAELLGKEGALFVPSGTMANQVALGAWTRPGDEIVVQRWAHVTTYESGAPGYLHGLQTITLGDRAGRMDERELAAAIRPIYIHCPRTALVCVEQTHNVAGGRVMPLAELQALSRVARAARVPVHMDGARLFNAVVASGISADAGPRSRFRRDRLVEGLGSGRLARGGRPRFPQARHPVRKRLGGWMRQAGFLAAAGLHALEHNVERLAEDHALARDLAQRLARLPGLSVDEAGVVTNLVMVDVVREDLDAAALSRALAEHGVLVLPFGPRTLRFVTHLDVGPDDVTTLEQACRSILGR